MTYGIIYKLTCKTTNMSYVGQTVSSLEKRWHGHCGSAKQGISWKICEAIRDHGPESFERRVLCECSSSEELNQKETDLIKEHNSLWPYGYNMRNHSGAMCEETRKKMSLAKKGKKLSKTHCANIGNGNRGRSGGFLGKKHTEEAKQKVSKANKGQKKPPRTKEHCEKLGIAHKGQSPWNKGLEHEQQPMTGKRHSDETKQKMRKARLGRPMSDSAKEKINKLVDENHVQIVSLALEGKTFWEIVEQTNKTKRVVKKALLRAIKQGKLCQLPQDTYGDQSRG